MTNVSHNLRQANKNTILNRIFLGKDLEKLSKIVSHALRHEPVFYDLILDKTGFVNISVLVASLRNHGW